MEDRQAAGLKNDEDLTKRMRNLLGEIADGIGSALVRGEQDEGHDDHGRNRDHDLKHAARLGAVSAQLLRSFVKLRFP